VFLPSWKLAPQRKRLFKSSKKKKSNSVVVRCGHFRVRCGPLCDRCAYYFITISMVEADTVNAFKYRLDKYWSNQDVLFDFNADLTGSVPICM